MPSCVPAGRDLQAKSQWNFDLSLCNMVFTENMYWSCLQFIYMAITMYVGMILYTCFNSAAKVTRKRRVLKKNFAGCTTSFFFGSIKSIAANSHRMFDVSSPNN